MRPGAEYFTNPTVPAQRRYEALRAYFVDQASAKVVGERFGYTEATVKRMANDLRAGLRDFFNLFVSSKPGPRGPRQISQEGLPNLPPGSKRGTAVMRDQAKSWIVASVSVEKGLTRKEMIAESGMTHSTLDLASRDLVATGELVERGRGTKTDPVRFFVSPGPHVEPIELADAAPPPL